MCTCKPSASTCQVSWDSYLDSILSMQAIQGGSPVPLLAMRAVSNAA